jgi:hypothetical protein
MNHALTPAAMPGGVRPRPAPLGGGELALVRVRITGPREAVAVAADRIGLVLGVAGESRDYPNSNDAGVRRYLDVLSGDDTMAGRDGRG